MPLTTFHMRVGKPYGLPTLSQSFNLPMESHSTFMNMSRMFIVTLSNLLMKPMPK